ncbi:MAG: anti-sigma factor family protein [Hyphomicrobiales bacterium]
MTAMKTIETWALHAYADGELDGADRLAIEELLANDAEARATLESIERQKQALKAAYDPVLRESLPSSLAATLRRRGGRRVVPYAAMAAGLALLIAGGAAGWLLAQQSGYGASDSIADRAFGAHEVYAAEVRHPVEVQATEKDHLQAWLSKRVGTAFVVPDLSSEGFTLLGGRLLAAGNRPAAQFMYEDAVKKRITIYLTANPGNTEAALRVEEKGGLVVCYWLNGPLGFAIAGEMDRTRMMQLARIVYERFES